MLIIIFSPSLGWREENRRWHDLKEEQTAKRCFEKPKALIFKFGCDCFICCWFSYQLITYIYWFIELLWKVDANPTYGLYYESIGGRIDHRSTEVRDENSYYSFSWKLFCLKPNKLKTENCYYYQSWKINFFPVIVWKNVKMKINSDKPRWTIDHLKQLMIVNIFSRWTLSSSPVCVWGQTVLIEMTGVRGAGMK